MEITSREQDGFTVVEVSGRLDTTTAPDFENFCTSAIDGGARKLVFDFSGVEFISSAGLRGLLSTAKRSRAVGGGVAVCALQDVVSEVFGISGFAQLMPVVEDLEAACAAL